MSKICNYDKVSPYIQQIKIIFDFETGVKTLKQFVSKVEDLSKSKSFVENLNDIKSYEQDKLNTFKGDMFELLSEIFFNVFHAEPSIGLRKYTPVPLTNDFGVDATAVNVNGTNCVVQCKYRSNKMEEITYGDLAKTYAAGIKRHGLSIDGDNTIFLITTCRGANYISHEFFGKSLRVINCDIIEGKIDNNQAFWEDAEEMILDTLDYINSGKLME